MIISVKTETIVRWKRWSSWCTVVSDLRIQGALLELFDMVAYAHPVCSEPQLQWCKNLLLTISFQPHIQLNVSRWSCDRQFKVKMCFCVFNRLTRFQYLLSISRDHFPAIEVMFLIFLMTNKPLTCVNTLLGMKWFIMVM